MSNPVIGINGSKRWYNEDGNPHRFDGPAIEYANGTKSWYIEGQEYIEEEFLSYTALYRFINNEFAVAKE